MKTILFDLDGTLVDTTELILASYRYTFRTHLGYTPPDAEIIEGFGTPLLIQLGRYAGDDVETMAVTYRRYNLGHHDALIKPIPGVKETLRQLSAAEYTLGLVTSKAMPATAMSLARFDLAKHFTVIVTSEDTVEHKPHPAPLLHALEILGADPCLSLYVGDSAYDLLAGKAAGTKVAAALWGPCGSHDLLSYQPDYALRSARDLLQVLSPLDAPH